MSQHTTTAGHLHHDHTPMPGAYGTTGPDATARSTGDQPRPRVSLWRVALFTAGGLLLGLAAQTALQHWRSAQAGPAADPMAWLPPASALPAPAPVSRPVAANPRPAAPRVQTAAVAQPAARPAPVQAQAQRPLVAPTTAVAHSPAGRLVPTPADDGHPAPAMLDASLIVAGEVHNAGSGRLALPAGTRFQVSVWADQAGQLAVYAVSPDGRASGQPLWRGPVQAGQAAQTATLRLAGTRGLETLQIVLRGPTGDIMGHRQLQIWHL